MRIKHFREWIALKEKLDGHKLKMPHVNEGEIWWASVGENIGYEINGKSRLFTRPVLIFKKLSREFYLIIPLTTQNHKGTWYVNYRHQGKEVTACLQQVRAIDYRRLSTKLGTLEKDVLTLIKEAFKRLYT